MKLLKIIKARLRKERTDDFVKKRLVVCIKCNKNTRNLSKLTLKNKILSFLSNTLDIVMFSKRNHLGSCSICDCPVVYLAEDPLETCGEQKIGNKSKWKL